MASRQDISGNRLDDAARAGWLYYVAGNNQEEIARKLNVHGFLSKSAPKFELIAMIRRQLGITR